MTQKNTGHLCSVYCPSCRKVTDKISWNLLRETRRVAVTCPVCGDITRLEYRDGKGASVSHTDNATLDLAAKILKSDTAWAPGKNLSPETMRKLYELWGDQSGGADYTLTDIPLGEPARNAPDDEDANLTLEKIKELHDGVEKRIDELTAKAKKRLAEKKKNKG